MKTITIFCISILPLLGVGAQDIHNKKINDAFETYRTAYLNVDRTALLNYVHPHVIQVSGGSEYVLQDITTDYNMYASTGLVIDDLILKQGSKIVGKGENLQAMYPYERHLKKSKEQLMEKGFFLVVSTNGGSSWTFTDMKKYDKESIKIFVPDYNERFNIYLNSTHN